jgi:hypothetical protein
MIYRLFCFLSYQFKYNIKALYLGDSFDDHSLIELTDYHNETQKSILAPGTMKNYYTTQRYIR